MPGFWASLPANVIASVLDHCTSFSVSEQYSTYRSCALTCASWRTPSQSHLFRAVFISTNLGAEAWLSSPAFDRFSPVKLILDGRGDKLAPAMVEKLLLHLPSGIRFLSIKFVRELGQEPFCDSSLATLTDLTLHSVVFCDNSQLQLPFQLTHLTLGASYFPLAFVRAIFTCSANSLVSLTLSLQSKHSQSLRETICQYLSTLKSLRVFVDLHRNSQDFVDIFPYLPPSLHVINTSFPDRHRITSLNRAVDLQKVPYLQELRLLNLTSEDVNLGKDGAKLIARCQSFGVQVTYGMDSKEIKNENDLLFTPSLKMYY